MIYRRNRSVEGAPAAMNGRTVREDAGRYLRANVILPELREKYLKRRITWQQYKTLRGQALAGDIDGAVKGLARIMRTQEREDEQ